VAGRPAVTVAFGERLRVDVGPAPPASAAAWIDWADEACDQLRTEPVSSEWITDDALDDVGRCLEQWKPTVPDGDDFRWQAEIDPERLEYLVHAFFRLDRQLSADVLAGERPEAPHEGRPFYVVLVRDLLRALAMESPGRAAFAERLRSAWPTAADAN